MTVVLNHPHIPTVAGHRAVAGTVSCACTGRLWLISCPIHLHCGHCIKSFHHWTDGSLLGLELVCTDGALTIRAVDFDVVLHRCGEDDTVSAAVEEAITRLTTTQVVPS